jgi:hypothetical protein
MPDNTDVDNGYQKKIMPARKQIATAAMPKAVNRPGIIPENTETPGSASGQGPKTPEGRALSSQNAFRYEVRSKSFGLRSSARLQTFTESFNSELNPSKANWSTPWPPVAGTGSAS